MKQKRLVILILQLIATLGILFLAYFYIQKEVEPVKAYVFKNDLKANEQIDKSDIAQIDVPKKAVSNNFALNPKDIIGKYVSTDVYAGQYVYQNALVSADKKDPFKELDLSKYRKISLPISYEEGFGGEIKKGDRLDLVFTGEGTKENKKTGSESKFKYAKTFMQDVLVYSVTTDNGEIYTSPSEKENQKTNDQNSNRSNQENSGKMAVITLVVDLNQAEEIRARQESGEISFVKRFDDSESYETLGYVLGDYDKIFASPANAELSNSVVNK